MSDHNNQKNNNEELKPSPTAPEEPTGEQTPEFPPSSTIQKADYYNPKEEIQKIWYIMIGVVIFVAVSFLTAFFCLAFDHIREKSLYLRYNDLQQVYSERNSQLKDEINELKIELNNLKKK